MAGKAGQSLSADEVAELTEYSRLGIAAPAKFDGIVLDNTNPNGAVYRFQTEAERKEAETVAADADAAQKRSDALTAKVKAEAAKRGAAEVPPVPTRPE